MACEPVNTAVIHEHAEYAREEAGEGEMKRMPKPGQLSGPVNHSNAARRRALISRKLLMNELMGNNARCQARKKRERVKRFDDFMHGAAGQTELMVRLAKAAGQFTKYCQVRGNN